MSFFVAYFYNRLLLVCCRENNVNVFMSSMCSRLFEKLCKHYLAEYLVCGDSCVSYCADWEPQLCRRRSSEDWKQNSKHGVKTELSTIELQERHVQVKSRQRFPSGFFVRWRGQNLTDLEYLSTRRGTALIWRWPVRTILYCL